MILFYLNEAVRIFRRSSLNSLGMITITSIAIFVTSLTIIIIFGANEVEERIKSSIEFNIYLENGLSRSAIDSVRTEITKISAVRSVRFMSKEEAKKIFLKETGKDFEKVLDENPLPNSFVVLLTPNLVNESNIDRISQKIKDISGVIEVVYDYLIVIKLLRFLKSAQLFIYFFSIILIVLAVYLVYSNNKILIHNQQTLYSTMKLVGAKESTMRIPVILNGLIIGIISSFVCAVIYDLSWLLLTKVYAQIKLLRHIVIFNLLIFIIGISLGFLGSYLSSRQISIKSDPKR